MLALRRSVQALGLAFAMACFPDAGLKAFYRFHGLALGLCLRPGSRPEGVCLEPLPRPWPLPSARIPALRRLGKALALALAFAFGPDPGLKAFL